jgi:transcription elongation factor GreA
MSEITWLTQEAYDRLQEELADCEGPKRNVIKQRIAAARDEGDLKENGGYHAAREEQGKNEARVRQLKHLLENSHGKVITVRFPAWGEEERFLLGSREEAAHASIEVYSPTSPLGAAVLGKRVGDSATYSLANGKDMTVEVLAVEAYIN